MLNHWIRSLSIRLVDAPRDTRLAPSGMPAVARIVQRTLYLLLFMLPLTGIASVWLEGHALTFLGDMELELLFWHAHSAGAIVARLHKLIGDGIMWLAGFHALAGLYHHFILNDGTLVSMLPSRMASCRQKA